MVVKSTTIANHNQDLQVVFDCLLMYGMGLNPLKCSFGLTSRRILGYLMTTTGIEANPDQIRTIHDMPTPKNKNEIQCFT